MPLQIKIATTNEEYDQVFQLRHQVLVNEGVFLPRPDGRINDRFDAFPTTRLIIALVDEQVIGTVRATIDSGIGTSVDAFYDFSPHVVPGGTMIAAGSHFYIKPAWRKKFQISTLLMGMFHYWLIRQGCRHVKGVMNPKTVSLMERIGYVRLSHELLSGPDQLPFVPILLDLDQLQGPVREFVTHQMELTDSHSFQRWYDEQGDPIIRG